MERTKKQKKLIIVHLSVFVLFMLVIGIFSYLYLLPNIKEIQGIKNSTYATFIDINMIEKKGISYNEFKSSITESSINSIASGEDSLYLMEVANNITEDFYNTYLKNDTSANYLTFLKEQSLEIGEGEPNVERNEIISSVLPIYSEVVSDLGVGSLSEFKFINYIESVMETFNLNFANQVGVSDVKLLENYSVGILDSSLETNIYYIPITFELAGKRSDVLDFLYFVGHVGKVYVKGEELFLDTEISSDFRDTFRNKILKGEASNSKIFNNQIIDIETIHFAEYIDPNTSLSDKYKENSLARYIKTTTFSEDGDYKAMVTLRFYVKGLPVYKIEQYISGFIRDFNQIQVKINALLSNTNITNTDKQKLMDMNNSMGQFEKSILPLIQKSLSSKDTINEGYNLTNTYYSIIDEYKNTLEQIESSLLKNNTTQGENLQQ